MEEKKRVASSETLVRREKSFGRGSDLNWISLGTIEGQLRISTKKRRLEIRIDDELREISVPCSIPDDLIEHARAASDKRVSLTGTIRSTKNGEPLMIYVEKLYVFPDASKLPSSVSVMGILKGSHSCRK